MKLNVTRNFNKVIADNNFIKKTSSNVNKINSEYHWFKQIPEEFNVFTPNVWNYEKTDDNASYKIEFIGAPTLQEKWVFGNLPDSVYYNIINQIFLFFKMTSQYNSDIQSPEFIKKNLRELYVNKTIERVKIFSNQINFNMSKYFYINNIKYPPLSEFVKKINNKIQSKLNNQKLNNLTLMQWDLCFSNMLTDSRSNTIKFVDPRGGLNDNFNSNNKIIGDYRYDIAKFGHSLVGNYDYIVTGFYNLKK